MESRRQEIEKLLANCITNEMGCQLYTGSCNPDKMTYYAYTRIWYPSSRNGGVMKSYRLGVHRHMYILSNDLLPCDLHSTDQISHLCHSIRCLTKTHLHLEDVHTNNERKSCKLSGRCNGHQNAPNCIF